MYLTAKFPAILDRFQTEVDYIRQAPKEMGDRGPEGGRRLIKLKRRHKDELGQVMSHSGLKIG